MKKRPKKSWWLIPLIAASISSCTNDDDTPNIDSEPKVQSNTITLEEAQTELGILLDDVYGSQSGNNSGLKSARGGNNRKSIAEAYSINISGEKTRTKSATSESIHVFNFENNGGFALMSGNRALPSLIALADSGSISEDKAIDNPGVAIFLEGLEEEYSNGLKKAATAGNQNGKVYGEWQNIIYKDNGYCKVKWGQGHPYNMYCPVIDATQCPTGCSATAIAQLMSIYKYPSSHNNYYLDWDAMTSAKEPRSNDQLAKEQVAHLMIELGLPENLNISYGVKGSGAATKNIAKTIQNLGYSNGGILNSYSTATVVDELKNGYPVIVNGFAGKKTKKVLWFKVDESYYDGHTWLCHGLLERRRNVKTYKDGTLQNSTTESEWYILCNWGWNCDGDGYYLSNSFNTKEKPYKKYNGENPTDDYYLVGYNFKYKITAVTGIRK